jgi:hypothetical protein
VTCTRVRVARFVTLVTLVGLLLAGCGGGAEVAEPTTTTARTVTTTTQPTTTTTAPTTTTTEPTTTTTTPPTTSDPFAGPPQWDPFEPLGPVEDVFALTGEPLTDPGRAGAAALVVKIDNHPQSRPQTAMEQADVVFEENVESLTRFIAVFHSQEPDTIGPVRSARTSDLPVFAALNRPIVAWSGGNPYVSQAMANAERAGILVEQGHPSLPRCYRRDRSRSAPHNLYADPLCLREASPDAGPARPLWEVGPLGAGVTGIETTDLAVAMDGVNVGWTWDPASERYLRSQGGRPHLMASGARLAADNVVVMTVEYVRSPADARSPEARTVGTGPVVVHRGGVAITGTWEREHLTGGFRFSTPDGRAITLGPGTVFVQLARG